MKKEQKTSGKVLVCQHGSRHRYAVPRLYEEAGMLAGLYTDSTALSPAGKLAGLLHRTGMKMKRINALISRLPDIPRSKIYSTDRPLHASLFKGLISPELDELFIRKGLQNADVVYNMCGEYFGFIEWAKKQGAKLIIDIFVHPATIRIIEEETIRYTGKSENEASLIRDVEAHFRNCFELADTILCPSEWVAEGVTEFSPQHAKKIKIVPYGSSLSIRKSINESPEVGTVLFAGREALRKGLHYLADAGKLLRKRGITLDIRVAGIADDELAWMENRGELNCLVTLPLNRMHHEFERADVFVLPSLSEGQAGVLLEAMACGCPVIATRESGVDFEENSGITIPVRNAEVLADAIESVIGNRTYRNQLAQGALRQAANFSLQAWEKRLKQTVEDLL